MEKEVKISIFDEIDSVLGKVNVKNITADGGSKDLPKGYYLLEIEKAEITTSKSSGNPQVAFQLKVVMDGVTEKVDENEEVSLVTVPHTKNRKVFKYYPLTSERIERFISDMLKFEGEKPGEPLLEKEYFTSAELLADALEVLVGSRIYCNATQLKREDDTLSTFYNFITWKRAGILNLPLDSK